ncbi:MAG TPA: hypothetical protein V6C71_06610 [Coleofasciculaceae cyanobacterium]|jgi:hypothetical protein
MFKSPKEFLKDDAKLVLKDTAAHMPWHTASRRDRSIIFQETLLDASIKNKFGFQEKDILPLFNKYQSKRQILINFVSFLTYVLQLPTLLYLRLFKKNNTIGNLNNRALLEKNNQFKI